MMDISKITQEVIDELAKGLEQEKAKVLETEGAIKGIQYLYQTLTRALAEDESDKVDEKLSKKKK
jgi:hypothetical protein